MMSGNDNIVYEISRMMNDKSVLRNDMNDAASLVMEMFKKKYTNRLAEKISEHRKNLHKNPPKEIQLINALRQFMPESEQQMADSAIEAFIMADTLARFRKETAIGVTGASTAEPETEICSSVHEDGIYDLDESCIKKKRLHDTAGMLMMAAMMMK